MIQPDIFACSAGGGGGKEGKRKKKEKKKDRPARRGPFRPQLRSVCRGRKVKRKEIRVFSSYFLYPKGGKGEGEKREKKGKERIYLRALSSFLVHSSDQRKRRRGEKKKKKRRKSLCHLPRSTMGVMGPGKSRKGKKKKRIHARERIPSAGIYISPCLLDIPLSLKGKGGEGKKKGNGRERGGGDSTRQLLHLPSAA